MPKETVTTIKSLGRVAYEANKEAWPPASQYVEWDTLTQQARDGWEFIARRVIEEADEI